MLNNHFNETETEMYSDDDHTLSLTMDVDFETIKFQELECGHKIIIKVTKYINFKTNVIKMISAC